ncbi:MAG: hypothetical protein ABIX01_10655 [Chitinophagaceae bacterium]
MTELIQLLQDKAGVTADQALKSLHAIKEYVTGKFPMLEGAVDNMFAGATDKVVEVKAEVNPAEHHSMLDKISDVIPGEAGQKIEDFAKNAAEKAGDAFDSVKEKIGGLFGNDDRKV